MTDDPRCCGSGTCIIDDQGRCWCGQVWDGTRMCRAPLATPAALSSPDTGAVPAADGTEPGPER